MESAAAWRRYYDAERASLGEAGLDALLERAPPIGAHRALVLPHTKLRASGHLVAAVARAVVRAERVLAIGVLHGARVEDAESVRRARAGDAAARARLRGVHREDGLASEEFSLDGLRAMLARATGGADVPEVIARYPFFVGEDPGSLPGIDELATLASTPGTAIVATTDPIHHGVGYGTAEARDRRDPATRAWAERAIRDQLDALAAGRHGAFLAAAERARSDFRDVGPVLAWILRESGALRFAIDALELVDYSDVLGAPEPTWVAAPLLRATHPDA